MHTNSISFGQKIPISHYKVQNNSTKEFADATLYELDCKDEEDIEYLEQDKSDIYFKSQILKNMQKKNDYVSDSKKNTAEDTKRKSMYDNTHFYVSELCDGNIIGVCETYDGKDYTDIEFISGRKTPEYKYVGQTMLASLGKTVLNSACSQKLTVATPLPHVLPYYTDVCGFKPTLEGSFNRLSLEMDKNDIPEFINNVNTKTGSSVNNNEIDAVI